jgi:hypothetical protein
MNISEDNFEWLLRGGKSGHSAIALPDKVATYRYGRPVHKRRYEAHRQIVCKDFAVLITEILTVGPYEKIMLDCDAKIELVSETPVTVVDDEGEPISIEQLFSLAEEVVEEWTEEEWVEFIREHGSYVEEFA